MAFEYLSLIGLIVLVTCVLLVLFKPRIHWGLTIVSALLAGSLFLALDFWGTNWGLWSYALTQTSGHFIGAVPVESILFFIATPLLFSIVWQITKHRVHA